MLENKLKGNNIKTVQLFRTMEIYNKSRIKYATEAKAALANCDNADYMRLKKFVRCYEGQFNHLAGIAEKRGYGNVVKLMFPVEMKND